MGRSAVYRDVVIGWQAEGNLIRLEYAPGGVAQDGVVPPLMWLCCLVGLAMGLAWLEEGVGWVIGRLGGIV